MTMAIRAKGTALSVICNVLINIVFNQVSPIAFADVGYKYYSLFVCTNIVGAIVVFFTFVETKGKSLEELAAIFGDEVIVPSLAATQEKMEALPDERVEEVKENDKIK